MDSPWIIHGLSMEIIHGLSMENPWKIDVPCWPASFRAGPIPRCFKSLVSNTTTNEKSPSFIFSLGLKAVQDLTMDEDNGYNWFSIIAWAPCGPGPHGAQKK